MAAEEGASRFFIPGFLELVALVCMFEAGDSARLSDWKTASYWFFSSLVIAISGFLWIPVRKRFKRFRKAADIGFVSGVHPFVQLNGTDQLLYRVAVKSKDNHSGVFLVISKIEPQPPGVAVTEIYLTQMHDRPTLNADGRWKKTFDLNQGQPIYIDVALKNRTEASILVMHGMPDHIDQRIPAGNYTFTLETRGPVLVRQEFNVTVDSNGVLGFAPLLSIKSRHKWGLGLSIIFVAALICYGVVGYIQKGEHAVNPVSQGIIKQDTSKHSTTSAATTEHETAKQKAKPTTKGVAPSHPVIHLQDSPGSAVSVNQQGGITAGTVVVDTPALAIKWTVQDTISDKPADFPFAQEVSVNVSRLYTPVSLAIICDHEINEFSVYGALTNFTSGISEKHIAFFRFTSPVLSLGTPLIIQVRGKQKFAVQSVRQATGF